MLSPIVKLTITVLAASFSLALRLQFATWRIDRRDIEQLDNVLARADRVLVTFWHGQYFPLLPMMRGRQICVFTSHSFRGRVIAAICKHFGYRCALIPERGHDEALQVIETAMRTAPLCATAADGPHGPARRFKPGLVRLASELQFAIVLLRVSATPRHIAKRRWDRRESPRPFARIRLHVGGPIVLPANLGPEGTEKWCRRLEEEANSLGAVRDLG